MIPFANNAMSATNGAHGNLRWKTTVLGSGASMLLIAASRYPQPFAWARASSIELDVGCRHRLAVRELHAFAQLEGVRLAVLRLRVAGREPRLQGRAVITHFVEGLVDLLGEPDR